MLDQGDEQVYEHECQHRRQEGDEGGRQTADLINVLQHRDLRIAHRERGEEIGREVLQQVGHADRRDHDGHTRSGTKRLIGDALNAYTECGGGDQCHRNGDVPWQRRHGENHEVAGHHEDISMGEVDQAQDAVDHRVADGDQCVGTAERDTCQTLLQEGCKRHRFFPFEYALERGWNRVLHA